MVLWRRVCAVTIVTRLPLRLVATLWLAGLLVGVALFGCSLAADERRQPAILILLPSRPTGTQTSIDSFTAARASLARSCPWVAPSDT